MKKYRTEKEWNSLFLEQENSSLSAAAFCKQKGIHPNLFYRKRSDLSQNPEEQSFVRVDAPTSNNKSFSATRTMIRIGSIEILPGQESDQNQLFKIFCSALEAVNAQL